MGSSVSCQVNISSRVAQILKDVCNIRAAENEGSAYNVLKWYVAVVTWDWTRRIGTSNLSSVAAHAACNVCCCVVFSHEIFMLCFPIKRLRFVMCCASFSHLRSSDLECLALTLCQFSQISIENICVHYMPLCLFNIINIYYSYQIVKLWHIYIIISFPTTSCSITQLKVLNLFC